MYRGFLIQTPSPGFTRLHADRGRELVNERRSHVSQKLQMYTGQNGELNADQLVKQWFPELRADVFISHSHLDKELAFGLVGWLKEKLGVTAFVDSMVWGSADELLKQIDDKYCKNKNEDTYNYSKRNLSTSHVHMMLAMAIAKMIDSCECLFLLSTPSSLSAGSTIDDGQTSSPWLFTEVVLSSLIRTTPLSRERQNLLKEESRSFESISMDSASVSYSLPLAHLTRLNQKALEDWRTRAGDARGQSALDALYKIC